MEILSTGEKIKRARIYKGITLKGLCKDEISISKLSCIENGKIKAEREILEYIAKTLNVDLKYLLRDVYEQIVDNLKIIKVNLYGDENIESKIKLNLDYALEYNYFDVSFDLMHILFSYYLDNGMYEKIQLIVSQYFYLYQRNNNEQNTIIYFKDMAQYLYQNGEINEALAYYQRLRESVQDKESLDSKLYCILCFNEGMCYSKIKNNEEAYKFLEQAIENMDYLDDGLIKGKICHEFAIVCIRLKNGNGDKYIKKAYEYQKENPLVLAKAMGEYAEAYFEANQKRKAVKEIKAGVELFPKHNKEQYVQFLNRCITVLIDNVAYDYATELSDQALDLAIETDNIKLVERAYFLKGTILKKQNNYISAELYMNLSMDALFKFAGREERYQRYLDMADLYYKLGEVKESLKYFNLAINLKEKM